tara:strand:+ start:3165 stop:4328 length:1164 start_codon:yes stop_codon:yes gene_type:complete
MLSVTKIPETKPLFYEATGMEKIMFRLEAGGKSTTLSLFWPSAKKNHEDFKATTFGDTSECYINIKTLPSDEAMRGEEVEQNEMNILTSLAPLLRKALTNNTVTENIPQEAFEKWKLSAKEFNKSEQEWLEENDKAKQNNKVSFEQMMEEKPETPEKQTEELKELLELLNDGRKREEYNKRDKERATKIEMLKSRYAEVLNDGRKREENNKGDKERATKIEILKSRYAEDPENLQSDVALLVAQLKENHVECKNQECVDEFLASTQNVTAKEEREILLKKLTTSELKELMEDGKGGQKNQIRELLRKRYNVTLALLDEQEDTKTLLGEPEYTETLQGKYFKINYPACNDTISEGHDGDNMCQCALVYAAVQEQARWSSQNGQARMGY